MADISATLTVTEVSATVTPPADVTSTLSSAPITATVSETDIAATLSSTPIAATLVNGGTVSVTSSATTITATLSAGATAESDPIVGAITGIVKADGAGNISAASAGTDYQAALGFTPPPNTLTISTTAPLTGGGDLSANRTLSITQSGAAANGYLSSTDWNTFNNKQPAGAYLTAETDPVYLASQAANITSQMITDLGNLSGTNSGDVTISTANGLSIIGQALSMAASASGTTGALSGTDWDTFNGKQPAGNYVTDEDFDANTILKADTDNTPEALTVTEQTVVGRLTGGDIDPIAIGIADDNIVQVDSADAADGEYAKFTANGLESKSIAETISDLAHKDTHDPNDGTDALDTAAGEEIPGVQAAGTGTSHSFARADHAHQIQHGITDNHLVTVDQADAADNEYARFTANGIEGRTADEAQTDLSFVNSVDVYKFGFVTNYAGVQQTTIAFNDTTYVFTLAPTGSDWEYYRNGIKYTVTGNKTVTLSGTPPTKGHYYIYIDATDGTLTASTTGWTLEDTLVPVATITWDNDLTPKYWLSDERHTCAIDRRYHWEHHFSDGSEVVTGPVLSGYTVDPAAPADTDNTFAISASILSDEDLKIVVSELADQNGTATNYVVSFRVAAAEWDWEASAMPYRYTSAGYIQYDSAGTMTQGAGNKYYNSFLAITNMQGAARFTLIPGQAEHSTSVGAQAEIFSDLTLTGVSIDEFVAVYQLIWQTSAAYSTKGKCRLAEEPISISVSASGSSSPGATTWGNIVGTITNQADILYGNISLIDPGTDISAAELEQLSDGSDTTLHDHDGISENTSARHTQGTDTALGAVGTKTPPIDADKAIYRDSTNGDALVTSTFTQVKAFLKTYFDTLYNKYVHPNHSGDVTSVADGAQTIANSAVTLAKMADMATASILGRNTAGTGAPEVLSKTTALSILNVEDGAEANNISDVNATDLTDGGATTLHSHAAAAWDGDITDIDVASSTDIGEAIADDDQGIIYNTSGVAWVRFAWSRVKTYIQALTDTLYPALSVNITQANLEELTDASETTLHSHDDQRNFTYDDWAGPPDEWAASTVYAVDNIVWIDYAAARVYYTCVVAHTSDSSIDLDGEKWSILMSHNPGRDLGLDIYDATGKTPPIDADSLALSDSASSNLLKKLTWANLKATLKAYFDPLYEPINTTIPIDGWTLIAATWTRTGNHTFTVATDVTAIYRKGTKVRYKDGGADEYGVVASSSYGAPNTTVTLITNSDYAMAATTITDTYLSYIEKPEGFPSYFNYVPTITDTGAGGWGVEPTLNSAYWTVSGGSGFYYVDFTLNTISPATGTVQVSHPWTTAGGFGVGRENAVTGNMLQAQITGNNSVWLTYNNAAVLTSGYQVIGSCTILL